MRCPTMNYLNGRILDVAQILENIYLCDENF